MANTTTIGSGTVAGAIEYLSFLSNKGHLTAGSVTALKTGFTKVTKTVGGDEWQSIDVRTIDVDEYLTRFANMTHGQYNAASLADYKLRVKKVTSWYLHFLSTPGWVPDVKARTRASRAQKDPTVVEDRVPAAARIAAVEDTEAIPSAQPVTPTLSKLVAFPFPLSDGTLANLYLPPTINAQDAKRMARFVESLVVGGTD